MEQVIDQSDNSFYKPEVIADNIFRHTVSGIAEAESVLTKINEKSPINKVLCDVDGVLISVRAAVANGLPLRSANEVMKSLFPPLLRGHRYLSERSDHFIQHLLANYDTDFMTNRSLTDPFGNFIFGNEAAVDELSEAIEITGVKDKQPITGLNRQTGNYGYFPRMLRFRTPGSWLRFEMQLENVVRDHGLSENPMTITIVSDELLHVRELYTQTKQLARGILPKRIYNTIAKVSSIIKEPVKRLSGVQTLTTLINTGDEYLAKQMLEYLRSEQGKLGINNEIQIHMIRINTLGKINSLFRNIVAEDVQRALQNDSKKVPGVTGEAVEA